MINAWESLYREAFPRVYRAVVAVLNDREAALDALHDAFEEGIKHPPPSDANLAGWLYRVALRRARRAQRGAGHVPLDELIGYEQPLERSLASLEVGRLLDLLTPRQREIVVAHYYLGLTQEEIADLLGIARGTVGATIAQALGRMRRDEHVR